MLLSHDALIELVDRGVITNVDRKAINASSIDIHLGDTLLIEDEVPDYTAAIDYRARSPLPTTPSVMDPDIGWTLNPGEFVLAQSVEVFNLPPDISAEYKLKSSMARIGLEHMNAGWCDAGWHGSVLTLELKNMLRYHSIRLRPGDPIGQMVFFWHEPVPDHATYATRGRYNNDKQVSGIKA